MRIIYIDIDSLRADHLGCYGYHRDTSPIIDELARDSAIFMNCHTSDAPCLPSRAALFSGRFGINNGVTCHDGPASQMRYPGRGHRHDPDAPLWMRVLQQSGWETVCFSGFGQRHLAWWFSAGFTQFYGNQLPGGTENADEVNAKVLPWLRANGATDNWFMHINYWDVHHPYRAPQRYFDRVGQHPGPAYPTADDIAYDVEHFYGTRTARDWWHETNWQGRATWAEQTQMPNHSPNTYSHYLDYVNGHDAGIAYVDEKIGEILTELEALGIRDETAIIVHSDHGESIGELGVYFEHANACEGTTHVPLIVHWPGLTEGGSVHDGLVYSLDLPSTVLDLLGIALPPRWDGQSIAKAVEGAPTPLRDHLVIGSGIYAYQRAVRTPQYRLIRTIHSGIFPYDPVYLFDMENDPGQRRNLAYDYPDIVAQHDHLLMDWLWHRTTGPAGVRDPFQEQLTAGFDPDLYCPLERVEQHLIDIGRDDQLADLQQRRRMRTPVLYHSTPRQGTSHAK